MQNVPSSMYSHGDCVFIRHHPHKPVRRLLLSRSQSDSENYLIGTMMSMTTDEHTISKATAFMTVLCDREPLITKEKPPQGIEASVFLSICYMSA